MDNVRAIYLTLEKLIQPEETQVNGIVILADYTGVGMSQASNPGPFLAKKVVSILQVRNDLVMKFLYLNLMYFSKLNHKIIYLYGVDIWMHSSKCE